MAFADLPKNRNKPIHALLGMHIFGRVCNENAIVHKLTKPYHPWTNGQAERMNRTIKDATIKVFHCPDLESLKAHVLAFVCASNFAKHLKALNWKTPYQTIVEDCELDPVQFTWPQMDLATIEFSPGGAQAEPLLNVAPKPSRTAGVAAALRPATTEVAGGAPATSEVPTLAAAAWLCDDRSAATTIDSGHGDYRLIALTHQSVIKATDAESFEKRVVS